LVLCCDKQAHDWRGSMAQKASAEVVADVRR